MPSFRTFWRFFVPVVAVALLAVAVSATLGIAATIAVVGIFATLIAVEFGRRFAVPLRAFAAAMERIRAGYFGPKLYISDRAEAAATARAFNEMGVRLAD